jgi:hypothetical protein
MPGNADQCRLYAVRCLTLSHHASSPEDQENLAAMAETWRTLAAQMECDDSLLRALSALEFSESSYWLPSVLKMHGMPHADVSHDYHGSLLKMPLVQVGG